MKQKRKGRNVKIKKGREGERASESASVGDDTIAVVLISERQKFRTAGRQAGWQAGRQQQRQWRQRRSHIGVTFTHTHEGRTCKAKWLMLKGDMIPFLPAL